MPTQRTRQLLKQSGSFGEHLLSLRLRSLCSRGTLVHPFVRLERRILEALASPEPSFLYPFTEAADAPDPAQYPPAGFGR